ncbi:hypothetical protein [Chryseobacterium sp. FH2]|uniref:hypothetical protein n=1 Tax=Chryseobacterium sp. FH2 TaxID=1674291 RepID=UPI000AE1C1C9|nr:hypothetical protein [Chryseobacterium sp. FH2]
MKRTKIDYINIFLAAVLVLLIIINSEARIKNKEQDKIYWNAEIHSISENSSKTGLNIIKVVDAVFYNNFNHSTIYIDYDSKELMSSKSRDSIYFRTQKELLPDSLSLKYFSIDERKFYLLTTKLSYLKMKDWVKNIEMASTLRLEIQSRGKILLKIGQLEDKNSKFQLIENFQAEETIGSIDMLVYKKSLGS